MKIRDLTEAGANSAEREKYGEKVVTDLAGYTLKFAAYKAAFEKYQPQIAIALHQYQHGIKIWRGVPGGRKMIVVDPTKTERRAANTSNYINLIVSNSPAWKQFPPRNYSLICSTDRSEAVAYTYGGSGVPYIVLPFGDPKIGVVPAHDFWSGFNNGSDVYTMNNHLSNLYHIIQSYRNVAPGDIKDLPNTPKEFFTALKWMDKALASRSSKRKMIEILNRERYNQFNINLLHYDSIAKGLEDILDPNKNDFKLTTLSTFQDPGSCEVWISAPAILIQEPLLQKLLGMKVAKASDDED